MNLKKSSKTSSGLKKAGTRILNAVIHGIFPPICVLCKNFFHPPGDNDCLSGSFDQMIPPGTSPENISYDAVMSQFLCPECCSKSCLPVKSPVCSKCGIMFKSREGGDHMCGRCIKSPPGFGIARSFGIYDGLFKEVIHAFKYRRKIQLGKPLGILLFCTFIKHWDPKDADIILPVPLHLKKLRQRTFNQTFLLIKDWHKIAEKLNTDISGIEIKRGILKKIRHTDPLAGMNTKERMTNVKNSFLVRSPLKIKDKRIILVDDVLTTGATAGECIKVLMDSGAGSVDILTLGRTMKKKI
ncbi:phosphoribosyltransferase domain-containing protein [Desulfonema limicola]|uniref:Phosphoribosyltransferase domain-containing protein n=2 Tax=Desulfonema limicola TaxID=45656 RepID=A0A975BEV4_9BACT|nr:phosphoribosyltransferase domain-containing protein [Desulfonema limicola]